MEREPTSRASEVIDFTTLSPEVTVACETFEKLRKVQRKADVLEAELGIVLEVMPSEDTWAYVAYTEALLDAELEKAKRNSGRRQKRTADEVVRMWTTT